MKKIEEYVRSIPDFPEPGIIFRDVTSILQDADGLKLAIDSMQDCLKDVDVDVIVGTESRGFIFFISLLYQYVRKENSHVRPFLQAMIWNMAKLRLRFTRMPLSQDRR